MSLRARKVTVGLKHAERSMLENPFRLMPRETIISYHRDLNRMITAAQIELERLKDIHRLVAQASSETDPDRYYDRAAIEVSEHAIVRYLERYKGLDTAEIAREIGQMIKDGRKEVAVKNRIVATVLPKGQCATWPGTRMRDAGGRFLPSAKSRRDLIIEKANEIRRAHGMPLMSKGAAA